MTGVTALRFAVVDAGLQTLLAAGSKGLAAAGRGKGRVGTCHSVALETGTSTWGLNAAEIQANTRR